MDTSTTSQPTTSTTTSKVSAAETAGLQIVAAWLTGGLLLVVGGVIAYAAHPTQELGPFGDPITSGSAAGFVTGLVIAGIGQVGVLMAAVATAVRLALTSLGR